MLKFRSVEENISALGSAFSSALKLWFPDIARSAPDVKDFDALSVLLALDICSRGLSSVLVGLTGVVAAL